MSVSDYTAKIKSICNSLGSINVNIDDDEMVQICLGGIPPRFGTMRTVILAREKSPSFFDLQSMLLVEENHVQSKTNTSDGEMFFSDSNSGRRRGRSGRGRFDLSLEGNPKVRKKMEAIEEPLKEGGASRPNKVGKACHLLATIVKRSAFAKRSAKKKEASRLEQTDNSQITSRTRNTWTTVDSS